MRTTSETQITWLVEPSQHRFVRERIEHECPTPVGPNLFGIANTKLIGFTDGEPRRIFFTRDTDDHYPAGCPVEGVDPLTITAPGVPGTQTPRSRGIGV